MSERRVLVVDDDEDLRYLIGMAMARVGGWEVESAGNGREAIEMARAQPFDLILMDIMMPDLEGPEALEILRGDPEFATPVIFLTAKVRQSEIQRVMALGAAGFIPKPFEPLELPAEIDRLLRV